MNKRRAFLLLTSLIATFAIVRAYLYFSPNADFNVGLYNIHHLYIGLLFITFCGIPLLLFPGHSRALDGAAIGFGTGLSLALDEWVYLIVTDGSNMS